MSETSQQMVEEHKPVSDLTAMALTLAERAKQAADGEFRRQVNAIARSAMPLEGLSVDDGWQLDQQNRQWSRTIPKQESSNAIPGSEKDGKEADTGAGSGA